MVNAIYGKKLGCTQIFDEKGNAVSVTAVSAEPCTVIEVKEEKDHGYNALKVGFGNIKEKNVTKPVDGIFKKAKTEPKKYLKEIRVDSFSKEYKAGDQIDIEPFKAGDQLKITARTKGKGFSGVIKRHNFHRGRMSHGSHSHRIPGAVGMCATPSRILKGKKMPGRMGNSRVTLKGFEVADVIKDQNIILIKGSVPGPKGNVVYLRKV